MAGGGGEAAVVVDLPDLVGDREEAVRVGDVPEDRRRPPPDTFVVAVRDREVNARASVGGGAEEMALLADADPPGVIRGRAEELHGRAVGAEPVEPLAEAVRLVADGPPEGGVADDPVEPVIEAVPQVARPGVGVAGSPAGEEDLSDVGPVVAGRILEKERVGSLMDDDAAVGEGQARRDVQALGEDGEGVGLAVAGGVLADGDAVASLALLDLGVRVVDALGDPEAPSVVPGHADRLEDVRLAGEELDPEAVGDDEAIPRRLRFHRLLHPTDGLALGAPLLAGQVVGDRRVGLHISEGRIPTGRSGSAVEDLSRVGGPADASLDEVLEAGLGPGPVIVPVGRVEDPAVAVGADPGPGLLPLIVGADLQEVLVRVVPGMNIGLIPGPERVEAVRDRVARVDDLGVELAGPVPLELGPDQLDVGRRVQEAEGGAVDRHEAAAPGDIIKEGLLLLRVDGLDVREDDQGVIRAERLRVEGVGEVLGVGDVDPSPGHDRDELGGPFGRAVRSPVSEEEDLKWHRLRLVGRERPGQQTQKHSDQEVADHGSSLRSSHRA